MMIPGQQTVRVTGEPAESGADGHRSWRLRVGRFWGAKRPEKVVLRPYFEESWIAAVRARVWNTSPQSKEIERLRALLADALDDAAARDVRRNVACALFDGRLASDKLTIPKEVAWLLAHDNPDRDVTIVNAGPYLELWPTARWQRRMVEPLTGRRVLVAGRQAGSPGDAER